MEQIPILRMERFGKEQIDEFRQSLENKKKEALDNAHKSIIDAVLSRIRKMILRAAVKEKSSKIINIDALVRYYGNGNAHNKSVCCITFEIPELKKPIVVELDFEFVTGAIYGLVEETFDLSIVRVPTETLEVIATWNICRFYDGYYEGEPRPPFMDLIDKATVKLTPQQLDTWDSVVIDLEGKIFPEYDYLYNLISEKGPKLSPKSIQKQAKDFPARDLRIIVDIPE